MLIKVRTVLLFFFAYNLSEVISSNSAPGGVMFRRTLGVRCPVHAVRTQGSACAGHPSTVAVFLAVHLLPVPGKLGSG